MTTAGMGPGNSWVTYQDQPANVAIGGAVNSQDIRKAILRPFWLAYRATLAAVYQPEPSVGTVYYVDPTVAGPGTGTFADPFSAHTSATPANNTVLIAEGTTYTTAIGTGGAGPYNYGCYDRRTGARIWDMERAAKVYVTSANVAQFSGTGGKNVFGGLHLVGARNGAGTANGLYVGTNTAGSEVIAEWCKIDDCEGSAVGALLSMRCEKITVRFCRASGQNNDILWCQSTSTIGVCFIYGNEFVVQAGTSVNGPDTTQLNRSGVGQFKQVRAFGNWWNHRAACKQGFFVGGGTATSGGEDIRIYRNFFWGIDVTGLTDLAGDGSGHTAMNVDNDGVRFLSNYVDGWRGWGNITGLTGARAVAAMNIFVNYQTSWYGGGATTSPMYGASTGSDYVKFVNNTFITINTMTDQPAGIPCLRIYGSNNVFTNNLFLGGWRFPVRFHTAGQTSNYNLFYGNWDTTIVGTTTGSSVALGANDLRSDPVLDFVGRPRAGSPVIRAGTPVTDWDGSSLLLPDPFGRIFEDPSAPWIGAAQALAT